QLQRPRHGTAQLGDLERMRQPGAKQVAFVVQEHLRLVDQAPEGGRVDDTVPVALVFGRVGRQQCSITSRTSVSGAVRTAALPGRSITTNLISPASAFLSSRISSR